MRLKKSLIALILLSFCGCATGEPQEPPMDICDFELAINGQFVSMTAFDIKSADEDRLKEVDWAKSNVHCINDLDTTKEYDVPFLEFMQRKPIATFADQYAKKIQWGTDLKKWGETHCKP